METRKAHCQRGCRRSICSVRFPVLIQRIFASILAVVLLSSADAQSRREGRSVGVPPPVVSQAFTMQRGEKAAIPLGIHGTRGELLEFLIRTPPTSGRISPVKSTGMNSAAVTYTASARGNAAEDRFTYAVRGSEGVSAAGVVTIRFVTPLVAGPKMRAPTELEFPSVFAGQRSTAELEIVNEGGGTLEGEVSVPEPWSIVGLKIFKIAAGRNATFSLAVTPAKSGTQTGEAIITGTARKVIPLKVTAEERLEASPSLLKLTTQPGTQTRMDVLKITNRTDEDATVNLEASARLLTDRAVNVPARGTASMPVFADAAQSAAFDDTVKLTSKEWSASVNVHAVAVSAVLKFASEEVSITGTADERSPSGTAILENSGGEPVTVRLDVDRPFEIEPRVVTAPARGRVEIPILVRGSGAGTFRSSLKAIGDGGSAVSLVKAEIVEASEKREPSRPLSSAPAAPAASENTTRRSNDAPNDPPTKEGEPLPVTQEVREIPNAFGKFARGTGTTTAHLEWPATLGPVENLRIEERVLSLDDVGDLQIGWAPLPGVTIIPTADRVTAELRGLTPGTLYTIRVQSGKDADATTLFASDFWTEAKKPFFTESSRTPLLGAALCVLLFAIWRSRRAQAAKKY